jgi:DNA-binding CsgD family transcriptional regulator
MQDQWDSLHRLLDCASTDELRSETNRHVQELGFDNWIYTTGSATPWGPYQLNEYPPDWLAHYSRQGYFDIDPVVNHCRLRTTPCLWASGPFARRAGYMTEFFREAADYGLRSGIGIPIHGPGGQWGMVSVATDSAIEPRASLQNLAELHLLATFMHEAGHRFITASTQEQVHLTARELDSLRWAAEGKTSWEIGQLLSIGERTVIFHLNNAARKLGVIGRRQAVARAISLQLITL